MRSPIGDRCEHYHAGVRSEITKDKPILLLNEMQAHGRTGNNLAEFMHAIQLTRDRGIQLG